MSASHSPDLSDIHVHTTTVAETLSVSTDQQSIGGNQPLSVHVNVSETQPPIPNVGASISVQDTSPTSAISERSTLLNLASNTLNLTDIITAQQQALEQFQCQLQLAQQTEAINQRLDAIERTLNNLIQQKAQEDAAKQQQQHHQVQAHHQSTPLRPSQQLHHQVSPLATTPEGAGLGLDALGFEPSAKRKKLPRELCAKVRSTYHSLNLEFKIDERFLSPANQRVTDTLIDTVFTETNGGSSAKDIKRAAHRYYESRRRVGMEDLPDRQEKAAEQRKKRKYRARQQRAYDRRKKFVRDTEIRYWEPISAACMTEESDSENGERIVTHQLLWRSEFLNQFVLKLDNRHDRSKKPGQTSTVKRERVAGHSSTSLPPPGLSSWMIDPNYKMPMSAATVCVDPMEGNNSAGEDVTTYSSLIADIQEVQDDSSDFELPDTIVA